MSRILNEEQIIDVIWGATLLGGGGGGSSQNGLDMLQAYKKSHDKVELELVTYNEMSDSSFAAVTAGMGSPAAIVGVDFSTYAIHAFELLQEMAKRQGKELNYCIPVELGGFNTFVPMLISLVKGIPFVDADGSGRAVPALETLLLNVNGCATSPLAMANEVNDKITIELADPYNAVLAEKLGRDVCIEFGMKAGLSGWMVTKNDIQKRIVDGSISLVEQIGHICRTTTNKMNIFEEIRKRDNLVDVKIICKGQVVEVFTDTSGGFDYGHVIVNSNAGTYRIDFQNENLLLSRIRGDKCEPIMTVPDIICMYCIKPTKDSKVEPGMPLSNADVKKGMDIGLGIIKVNEKWFNDEKGDKKWWTVWEEYLKRIDYTGENIPFEDVKL